MLPWAAEISNCSVFSSCSPCREPLGGSGCRSVVAPSRTVSAASIFPGAPGSPWPRRAPGASQQSESLRSLCHVCCCLSPAWGNCSCLQVERFSPALPSRVCRGAGAAVLAAGALLALLALGKHGRSVGAARSRSCCLIGAVQSPISQGSAGPGSGRWAEAAVQREPRAAAGRGFADLLPFPLQSPSCTRKSVREA